MSKLSPEQIAQHAYDAGFRGKDLTTAVAVAMAESGGQTTAHNPTPPDDSYGLWQINMHGSLGPDRREEFDLDSDKDLFDPKTNAEAAFEISGKGDSFQPWTTFTGGAYEEYLGKARRAAQEVTEDGGRHKPQRKDGKQGGAGRYVVDTDALGAYVKSTRSIADELGDLRGTQLRQVRGIAEDSFGKLGKETGFSAALNHFAGALQHQVKAIGANAEKMSGSVGKSARTYREHDDETADKLMNLLREP